MIGARLSLLATLALFTTAAKSASVIFTNGLPQDSIIDEGTTFNVTWSWDGGKQAMGQLILTTFTKNDMNSAVNITLEDNLNLSKESYPWVVKASSGHKSLDWYYKFGITYNGNGSPVSGRAFRINTASTTSTTSGTGTATNSPGNPKHPSDKSSLSGGAIAGIVVGSVAGVGIIAALVGLVLYYRRKSRRGESGVADLSAPDSGVGNMKTTGPTPEIRDDMGAVAAIPQYGKAELDATERQSVPCELDAGPQMQGIHNPSNGPVRPEIISNIRS
ncbi:hypothetical protein RRF57_011496 [Xylaria bambusicola]|uniref:Mid2 domain-containing protein n=1 Tax=Xylaria bambusicola TaxID=326684 RepID=A0AAN7UWU9_9PEZI